MIYRCDTCKTLYLYPIPETYADLYDAHYFMGGEKGYGYPNYDEEKQVTVRTFETYLDLIESRTRRGTILDIGAATGFFLERARVRGWKPIGVEIADHARELMAKKGIRAERDTGSLSSLKGEMDAVTLLDTIEHTDAPDAMLASAHALLKKNGILALNTPDAGSWFARLAGKAWHLIIPPEHVYLFTKKSLFMLLERNGFSPIIVKKIGKRFTLHYVFRLLSNERRESQLLKNLASFFAQHRIGTFSFPLNVRDNIFILAEKI